MADLVDFAEGDIPPERRLRLSLKWCSIQVPYDFPDETFAYLQIGLFMGDTPLFADALYAGRARRRADLLPGYFAGEDENCNLLSCLLETLKTGKCMEFEDFNEPDFKLYIGPDVFSPDTCDGRDHNYVEVLAIIQNGGPWHGAAVQCSGPAMFFSVNWPALDRFFRDLLAEALDPAICEEPARRMLLQRFEAELASR